MLAIEIINVLVLLALAAFFGIGFLFKRGRSKEVTVGEVVHVVTAYMLGAWLVFLGSLSSVKMLVCLIQRMF